MSYNFAYTIIIIVGIGKTCIGKHEILMTPIYIIKNFPIHITLTALYTWSFICQSQIIKSTLEYIYRLGLFIFYIRLLSGTNLFKKREEGENVHVIIPAYVQSNIILGI